MKKVLLMLAFAGMAVGCGGGVCSKAEEAAEVCEEKHGEATGTPNNCEESIKDCSDADLKKMEEMFDCLIDNECATDKLIECAALAAGVEC